MSCFRPGCLGAGRGAFLTLSILWWLEAEGAQGQQGDRRELGSLSHATESRRPHLTPHAHFAEENTVVLSH